MQKGDKLEMLADRLEKECPILKDENFLNNHPGVYDMAAFIYCAIQTQIFSAIHKKGWTLNDYLNKLNQGDKQAITMYENSPWCKKLKAN